MEGESLVSTSQNQLNGRNVLKIKQILVNGAMCLLE